MSWATENTHRQEDSLKERWNELWRIFNDKGVANEVAELLLIERAPFKAYEREINDCRTV